MLTSPLDQTGLTPAFAMALARVVVSWGGLEETLRAALADLYRDPRTAGCRHTDVHTFSKRLRAWAEAVEWIEGDRSGAAAAAADVARRGDDAVLRRNLLVHGCWPANGWTDRGCTVFSFNALDRGILKEAEVTTDGLAALAGEIENLGGIIAERMVSKMARDAGQGRSAPASVTGVAHTP